MRRTPGEPVLVAVDGGQSALRLAAGPSCGRTPLPTSAPGFRWSGDDPVATIARDVEAAWRTALDRAGGSDNAGASLPRDVSRVVLGLSGLPDDAEDQARLGTAIADLTGANDVWLCRDMVTAHAGALPGRDGVVLAVGTGVACLGVVRESAETFHADGWGYLLGDAGGAFWIGRAGLQAVFRAYDGRDRPTTLTPRAVARYGPHDGISVRVHNSPTHVDDIARFAQDVCAEAESGDETARAIVAAAAGELAATAAAVATRYVASTGRAARVASTGRLIAAGGLLHTLLDRELRRREPRSQLIPPAGTSLDGAWTLAVTADPAPYSVTRLRRP